MATYKKRGSKRTGFSNKNDNSVHKSTTANVFDSLDEGASKSEKWVANNQKYIFQLQILITICVLSDAKRYLPCRSRIS